MTMLKKAYHLLDRAERRQAWFLLAFSVLVALFEMVGTLSVMPFLAVLADPGQIERNGVLSRLYDGLGYTDTTDFLILLGAGSVALLLLAAAMRALGQYVIFRFTAQRSASIARRLLEAYLRQPYAFFLRRHSSDMSRTLLQEVTQLSTYVYQPLTAMAAQLVLVISLLTLLVLVDPVVALSAGAVLGLCYAVVFLVVRRGLERMGRARIEANKQRFRLAGEVLGGIKTVKISGNEWPYLNRFAAANQRIARLQTRTQTLGALPRYGIEAVAFSGIILLSLILLVQYRDAPGGALGRLLPILGLYAFVGYRLMPALQKIYMSMTQLRFGAPVLDVVAEDLAALDILPPVPDAAAAPLPFHREVVLDGLGYRHAAAEMPALQDIALTLPKGSSLGIVGTTGAGKTTLMDVFLGLLTPESGEIRVDGTPVTPETLRAWQAGLGYVPQDIFLLDASIAQNIAFGVPANRIDMDQVRRCADMAQLTGFVESQLPEGFATEIGERGVRLSGGQRQRIGIARALYHDPDILVFDEATSALDTVTERAVVEAIGALSGSKTILLVAHRLSTVQECDQILVLDRGRMMGLGPYHDLYDRNAAFRSLVNIRPVA